MNLTNRMWFSVVCTLVDNDMCHHSGQNVEDSRGAADWVNNILIVFFTTISTSKRELNKALRDTWREQRGMDSYRQRQISKSDSEIRSNCGKNFFDVDIVVKSKSKFGLSWSVLLSTTRTRHYSLPKYFFRICMLSEFTKVFERKVWRVQVAHLHNAARVLSSSSRCGRVSQELGTTEFTKSTLKAVLIFKSRPVMFCSEKFANCNEKNW